MPRLRVGVVLHHLPRGLDDGLVLPRQALLGANGSLHAQLVDAERLEPLGELGPVLVVLEMKAEALRHVVRRANVQRVV